MNTCLDLLFHLDIPLEYISKLTNYYYIPENRISELQLGGYMFIVDKYILNKQIKYLGIVTMIDKESFYFKKNGSKKILELLEKYHVFYRPNLKKMNKALKLIHAIL